jgi:recombinational DNA repair protein (RecF pathway)
MLVVLQKNKNKNGDITLTILFFGLHMLGIMGFTIRIS